jgi:hypothetical protein
VIDADNTHEDRLGADQQRTDLPEVCQVPVVGLTASEVTELVGCQPDLLPSPEPRRAREATVGMTDEQVLVHYRDRHGKPVHEPAHGGGAPSPRHQVRAHRCGGGESPGAGETRGATPLARHRQPEE